LIVEQIIHYFTTYGAEALGIYDKDHVFIPEETLEIPELREKNLRLVVIHGYTKEELKGKILQLLNTGIALADQTKKDVIDVATFVEIQEKEISTIKNKEVKCALFEYLDMFPENPVEFLRFVIYKLTNKTLLIKDKKTITEIKMKDGLVALGLIDKYNRKFGLENLSQIFYRFKPLWLAIRSTGNRQLKTRINRIRKLAKVHHKPMPEDYLNSVTAKIKGGETIDLNTLTSELKRVNLFRKARLANALIYRQGDCGSVLYKVRNGKSYATEFYFPRKKEAVNITNEVVRSIVESLDLEGKRVFLPPEVDYTIPTTEKQYTGNFPSGTCVRIPKDMVFGIHWCNVGSARIDLDLSMHSINHGKIGWNSSYRSGDRKILFSGDVTDAPGPKGASELFYIAKASKDVSMVMVNYFNFREKTPVPFEIVVAKENVKDFGENYMLNPNNIVVTGRSVIDTKQKMLGLIVTDENDARFYFSETMIGSTIVSRDSTHMTWAREYLVDSHKNALTLRMVLELAGAKIVDRRDRCDIDLSPEVVEKDTIINLLTA